jgi:hypothetical protein
MLHDNVIVAQPDESSKDQQKLISRVYRSARMYGEIESRVNSWWSKAEYQQLRANMKRQREQKLRGPSNAEQSPRNSARSQNGKDYQAFISSKHKSSIDGNTDDGLFPAILIDQKRPASRAISETSNSVFSNSLRNFESQRFPEIPIMNEAWQEEISRSKQQIRSRPGSHAVTFATADYTDGRPSLIVRQDSNT